MFALTEPNSLVADLDIVVVDANPLAVEGGSGDSDSVTVTITLPWTITITYPSVTISDPITLPFTITVMEQEVAAY